MGRTIEQTLGYLFGLQRFEENPELDATIQKTLQRYPSLRSDGKVRKNETRPTRQEEHSLAGPEQNTKSHNEQIEEIRKNTQPPFQPTDYTGLKLDNRLADQIAQQPAAELLTFERVGNKTRIQAKLPEKGCDPETGEEYNIRVNMNYFVRGIVTAVMDENGNLNSAKAIELDALRTDLMVAVVTNDQKEKDRLSRELIDKLIIPEEDRPDFERFFRTNNKKANHLLVNGNTSPIKLMTEEIQKLSAYQYLQEGNALPEDLAGKVDPQKWNGLLKDSREDYEHLCESYRAIAEMDPKEEKRILQPSDCTAFRYIMTGMVNQYNNWREQNGKEKIDVNGQDYFFSTDRDGYPPQKVENGNRLYFAEHHLVTVPIKLDGKDVVLTLENTAPPAGKPLERPAVERTGVGLFQNETDVKDFHYNVNRGPVTTVDEISTFNSLSGKMAGKGRTLDANHLDAWEREAFRAKEQAKTGSDAEVTDCFARHLYAQSIVASADRAKRLPYYKNLFDKSVEELKASKSFKLMAKTYGVKGMREALSAPNPQAASMELFAPQQGKRYAVNDTIRKQQTRQQPEKQQQNREQQEPAKEQSKDPEAGV